MAVADRALDSREVATPRPLAEVAQQIGVSTRVMWDLVRELNLTKYRMPGSGKLTYLDIEEVRRKRKPKPVEEKADG